MTMIGKSTDAEAIVVHCSDPRFQKAFRDFVEGNLGLKAGRYIPIIVPGSIASLGVNISMLLPKRHKVLLDNIKLMLERRQGETLRLILINHEDCKSYAEIFGKMRKFLPKIIPDALAREIGDLAFAANLIRMAATHFKVNCAPELYMARINEGGEIVFDQYALE